jgi:hypothetical protein
MAANAYLVAAEAPDPADPVADPVLRDQHGAPIQAPRYPY